MSIPLNNCAAGTSFADATGGLRDEGQLALFAPHDLLQLCKRRLRRGELVSWRSFGEAGAEVVDGPVDRLPSIHRAGGISHLKPNRLQTVDHLAELVGRERCAPYCRAVDAEGRGVGRCSPLPR